mmetsp:Transcript_55014/g.80750  ORF Transcript_55014/g.80750 Transcript_55014/m.80750 type:complete len:173 (+) Transcript_55014:1-519(+)
MLLNSKDVVVDNGVMVRRRDGVLPPIEQPQAKKMKTSEIIVTGESRSVDVRSPDKSVYVGNLAQIVTDVILFELFSQVGPVERVTVPLSDDGGSVGEAPAHRGFAFVQFSDGAVNGAGQSVEYAIKVLHDVCLYERRITVRRSSSTHNQGRMGPEIWKHSRIVPGDMVPYDT